VNKFKIEPVEPEFSQPTRHTFLMILVLILVMVGAYFMFPAVAPIFFAAPYLNGLILSVFVLGILACFWQVFILVSAVNWIVDQGVKEEDIILYGESLGTGIATEIAQNKNFAGVILETPFTSMINAAKEFYPYIPVNLLLKDRFENFKKIKNINSPILIMHGEQDTIVPFSMGKKIYQLANEPKYSFFTKHDDHMMVYDELMIKNLKNFIQLN